MKIWLPRSKKSSEDVRQHRDRLRNSAPKSGLSEHVVCGYTAVGWPAYPGDAFLRLSGALDRVEWPCVGKAASR